MDADKPGDIYLDHVRNPRNRGRLSNPSGVGSAGGGQCADTITITVSVREDVIADIAFESAGCDAMIACGSAVTELVKGAHLDEAAEIDAERVVSALGGLPADNRHVAQLSAEALANAMWDYIIGVIENGSS